MQLSSESGKVVQDKSKRIMDTVNQGDFPAAMEHVSKLMAAALSSNSSARDVSKIILKDLGLTNKVLKIANSAYYSMRSQGVRQISTITGAVVLLGFKVVRDIAASVSLFDYLAKKTNNIKELKRMVALSFTGASFAKELSRAINYPDEEEAYLCGLFHDLGRMIAAFMLPDVYAKIQKDMQNGISETQATKTHMGMTVRDLGISVAKVWNFSDKITKSMEAMPEKQEGGRPSDTDILRAVASMGHLISQAAYSGKNTEEEISRMLAVYGKILPINESIIDEAMEEAGRRASELMAPLGIDMSVLKPKAEGEESVLIEEPEPTESQMLDESERQKECILNASVEITESIVRGCDLDSIFMIIMESMQHGLGYNHVLLAIVDPARTMVKARYGIGEGIEDLVGKLILPLKDSSGIMASSIAWGKDMTVTDKDMKLPEADKKVLASFNACAMAALPILVDGRAIGNFLVAKQQAVIDAATMRQTGRLRDYAVLAIESTRSRIKK